MNLNRHLLLRFLLPLSFTHPLRRASGPGRHPLNSLRDGTVHAPGFLAPFRPMVAPGEGGRSSRLTSPATPRRRWPVSSMATPKVLRETLDKALVAQSNMPNRSIR